MLYEYILYEYISYVPRCALMDAYRAVPVKFLSSRYGMCWRVRLSLYFFANPKSMRNSLLQCRPIPIRKLSGLMSVRHGKGEREREGERENHKNGREEARKGRVWVNETSHGKDHHQNMMKSRFTFHLTDGFEWNAEGKRDSEEGKPETVAQNGMMIKELKQMRR